MPSSNIVSLAKYLLVRIVRLLRRRLAGHPSCERDSPSDLFSGSVVQNVSKGFCILVPARFRERGGLWIDSYALASPLLMLLPKGLNRVLRNAKDSLDWRDKSNSRITVVFIIIAVLVIVCAIDDFFQTPPI